MPWACLCFVHILSLRLLLFSYYFSLPLQKFYPPFKNPPSRSHQIPLILFKITELFRWCRTKRKASGKIILSNEWYVQNVVEGWWAKGRDSLKVTFNCYINVAHFLTYLLFKIYIYIYIYTPTTYRAIIFSMTSCSFKTLTIPQQAQRILQYLKWFL